MNTSVIDSADEGRWSSVWHLQSCHRLTLQSQRAGPIGPVFFKGRHSPSALTFLQFFLKRPYQPVEEFCRRVVAHSLQT